MDHADIAADLQAEEAAAALARHRAARPAVGSPSATWCETCGDPIPQARRAALPGVTLCCPCATRAELRARVGSRAAPTWED